ncbi:MAG: hypothetical protein VCD00_05465 [Candidatus Hydrogenedentota bacterium]
MSNDGYITCECGYEMFLPKERIGRRVECIHCGAMIDTSQNKPGPRTVPEFDTSSPKSDRIETPSLSSSPFEDGDEEDLRPSVSYSAIPKATPEIQDEPQYNPSAFEDDDEEEVDADAPPAPDASLIRSYEDPEHSNAYQNVQNAETCPKCGNPYRGDWDKQNINGEAMCYICSSQATETIPDRILNKPTVAPDPVTAMKDWTGSVNAEIPEGPMEEIPWFRDPESKGFRHMIYWMAFSVIAVTVIAVITMGFEGPPTAPSSPIVADPNASEQLPMLPQWATITYWIMVAGMRVAGLFLSFYLVLSLTNRLPSGDWKGDCITIGFCVFCLFIGSSAYFAVLYFASDIDPIASLLTIILATICGGFAAILIVMNTLDFRIRDFIYLAFLSGPVHGFMTLPATFIYAALANIAL